MIRKLMRKCIVAALCLASVNTFAQKMTEAESFIARVKETNNFVPVTTIWQADNNFDKSQILTMVEDAQPLTIDYNQVAQLMKQKLMAISLTVPTVNGGSYTLDLARYDFLTNDFEVHAIGPNKSDGVYPYTPGLYYRGTVNGIKGSLATLSVFNNEVYALFSIPGLGNFLVVPNIMVGKYYDYNQHYLVYNDNDLKIKDQAPQCYTDQLPKHEVPESKTTTTVGNNVYNNCSEVRVFEVGDYALYLTKGSSVTNVANYLTALFNNQALLYRNEGIPITLKYVQIDSVTDVYQTMTIANSGFFLDKFGYETQNVLHGCDLAILASTRLNGGYGAMGGVAWLKAICQTYVASDSFGSYAFCNMDNSNVTNFPTFSWDVEVITHEMGHIVGSPHTHRCCWNPPGTGTTAIDGCYTLEGSCATPSPAHPVGGGTIMSYCHLTSVGINLSNGFGQQPGDTVRYYLSHHFTTTCGDTYNPATAIAAPSRSLAANRECTDLTSGITYYWNDHNTASHTDDTMVLMIKKNGNVIGDLNTTGFSVMSATIPLWGTGVGRGITFPAGTAGISSNNMAMRRYWRVNATTRPATAVEVIFPFLTPDTADVDGSISGPAIPMTAYMMYKADSAINPSPDSAFVGATSANFQMYTNGTTASTTNWSLSTSGSTLLAHMLMTSLSGGGTGFYSYGGVGFANVAKGDASIYVYPNPTDGNWFVSVAPAAGTKDLDMQIYAADGKLVRVQALKAGSVNSVSGADMPTGIYYYRIVGNDNTYTGSLLKK